MFTFEDVSLAPTENESVVRLERDGLASGLVQHHRTYISDPEVRAHIQRMSHMEVIA